MKIVVTFHINNLSVAARDHERKEWKFWLVTTEPVGINVGFEMVDRVERNVVKDGGSAGGESANEEGTDEAWRVGDGDSVNILPIKFGIRKSLMKDGIDGFDVRAGGDFWNNASVSSMDIDLRDDDIGKNAVSVLDDGGRSFVTRTLDAKNAHIYLLYHKKGKKSRARAFLEADNAAL